MQTPPVVPSQDEREVDECELARLNFSNEKRQTFASDFDAFLENERITHSNDFGYIFRYEASKVMEGEDGISSKHRFHLILWSEDCTEFFLATHSDFKLPDVRTR